MTFVIAGAGFSGVKTKLLPHVMSTGQAAQPNEGLGAGSGRPQRRRPRRDVRTWSGGSTGDQKHTGRARCPDGNLPPQPAQRSSGERSMLTISGLEDPARRRRAAERFPPRACLCSVQLPPYSTYTGVAECLVVDLPVL